jgi:hypothetical protein
MAALGREAMALGQLNYQVSRWATNPGNNNIAGTNSPQCTDVKKNLIHGDACRHTQPLPLWRRGIWASLHMVASNVAPRRLAE